jgi:hypothetical protein
LYSKKFVLLVGGNMGFNIISILVIAIITFAGGYVRLCAFGSFSFVEATFLIIAIDLGVVVSTLVLNVLRVESQTAWIFQLVFAGIMVAFAEFIYRKRKRKSKTKEEEL